MFKKVIGQDLGPTGSPSTPPASPSGAPSAPQPAASSYSVPATHAAAAAPSSAARPGAGATRNVLSSDVEIKGTVKFTNDLVVDGKIEGEITSEGNLTVGENARIKAEIKTGTVIIYGKVHGNITVSERVELKASAEVVGDIKAKTLSIEAGAIFVGKSTVGTPAHGSPASKHADAPQQQGDLAGTPA